MPRHPKDQLDTGEREAIAEAVGNTVRDIFDEKSSGEIDMDEKIRRHKEECGKPLAADMRVVQEFSIRMDVHMRQVKWLIAAAIVALLSNGGLGRLLGAIVPVQKAHSTESQDASTNR